MREAMALDELFRSTDDHSVCGRRDRLVEAALPGDQAPDLNLPGLFPVGA
jgi:hypothetical protein